MLENFMGDEMFRIGVKRFLEKYKYANAVTKDLWRELEAISVEKSTRLNIEHIMDTWTLQMGFPLVTIRRNYQDNTAIVSQERFLVGEKVRKLYTFCSFLTNMCFQETWSIGFEMVGAVDIH